MTGIVCGLVFSMVANVWLIIVLEKTARKMEVLEKAHVRSLAEDAEADALVAFVGNHFGAPRMGGNAPIVNRMGMLRWLFEHLKKSDERNSQ